MKKLFLAACLLLGVFAAPARAQFFTSETTRKAGEKMSQGDRAGALAILDKAIEKRKDLVEAHQMRANLRASVGDLDGAIADYSAVLEINPNDAKIYQQRARFRIFKRDYAAALNDLDAAIARGLKTEKVYEERGSIKRDMGDLDGAVADYRVALAANPNYASAHTGLAFTLERKGEVDAAIAHLQAFVDRYEAERGGKLPSTNVTQMGEGFAIKREGKEKDGSQAVMIGNEVAVPFTANSPEEMEKQQARHEQLMNLAILYGNLGNMYARRNQLDKALETYAKGLQVNKGNVYIHKMRGAARIKAGDLQGAIEDLTVAVNSRMAAPDRHLDKGLLLTLQGRDEEAEKEFALHRRMFPDSSAALDERIEEAKKLRARPPQQ